MSTPVEADVDESPVSFYQVTTFGVGDQRTALAKAKEINESQDMVEGLICSRVCCSGAAPQGGGAGPPVARARCLGPMAPAAAAAPAAPWAGFDARANAAAEDGSLRT